MTRYRMSDYAPLYALIILGVIVWALGILGWILWWVSR